MTQRIEFTVYRSFHKSGTSKAGKAYSFYQSEAEVSNDGAAPAAVVAITSDNELKPGKYSARVIWRAGQFNKLVVALTDIQPAK